MRKDWDSASKARDYVEKLVVTLQTFQRARGR